jgi:hypothetical protein
MIRALLLATLALALAGRPASAQDTLGVERLQEAALRSDPRANQQSLLRAATDLRVAVIGSQRLPQLQINGQGTHQSDVTRPSLGLPGVAVPELPKDRWQTTLDLNQRLYDGGEVARRLELEESRHSESQAALAVALFGNAPRFTALAWVALAYGVVAWFFGMMLRLPDWLMRATPFDHTPQVPAVDLAVGPIVLMGVAAFVLVAIGLYGIRRRDFGAV